MLFHLLQAQYSDTLLTRLPLSLTFAPPPSSSPLFLLVALKLGFCLEGGESNKVGQSDEAEDGRVADKISAEQNQASCFCATVI